MNKTYKNEKLLTESILNYHNNIDNYQQYLKNYFKVESYYDNNLSIFYIWENNKNTYNLNNAQKYLQTVIPVNMCEIVLEKPMYENENDKDIYVVYYADGTMDSIYYTKEEAENQVTKLNKEYPDNKAFYKQESSSNYQK